MRNPFTVFNSLRETYLRYLDSPFDLRYPDLVQERREMLNRDGRIYRQPLLEVIPAYRKCDEMLSNIAQRLLGPSASWPRDIVNEFIEFVALGLFPSQQRPYIHQKVSLEESVVRGRDMIITTGAGSGKTECFLLPIAASLILESTNWTRPRDRDNQWDWWRHYTTRGQRRVWAPRIRQRNHDTRASAMRALILYPLNALVEDQLARLRGGFDSPSVRSWLDDNRSGNRFYFGRYKGRTTTSGARTPRRAGRLREELTSIDQDARRVAGTLAERFFQSMDGSEMWSRWDMQDNPPDILVTNYVMLNIMLMREVETPIFNQTREWLQADPSHVFHLVVDELHTYRGTAGTEVAYLLRALYNRLSVTPDSNQLRIIASSASLEDDPSGLDYLQGFFGRSQDRFRVISGEIDRPDPNAIHVISGCSNAFRELQLAADAADGDIVESAAESFNSNVGGPYVPESTSSEQTVASAIEHIQAPDALRVACASPDDLTKSMPRTPDEVACSLFPELPANEAL